MRFKNEFRSLQDVHHPNLVRLGELFEEKGQWFFTMELVCGVDFLSYVREGEVSAKRKTVTLGAPPLGQVFVGNTMLQPGAWSGKSSRGDESGTGAKEASTGRRIGDVLLEERLRHALGQLVAGLVCLHKVGKVHRDIKPANVLVTEEGRVVILDFGLVTGYGGEVFAEDRLVGTVGYMAPEQAGGGVLGPKTDWYSVGVLLYLALTGYPPYRQASEPDPPSTLAQEVPPDLESLCMRLLQHDSNRRAGVTEVCEVLGLGEAVDGFRGEQRESCVFVGREAELSLLEESMMIARQGKGILVLVSGESGVGKSALVDAFVREQRAEQQEVLILRSRCYERESVPFRGIDGIVDALSQFLSRLEEAELATYAPEDIGCLVQLFPALRRVRSWSALEGAVTKEAGQEQRVRGARALRGLLAGLAAVRPILLTIDDLQWADADSWWLLSETMRQPHAPPLAVVGTTRALLDTEDATVPSDVPSWKGEVRRIPLTGLSQQASRALAQIVLRETGQDSVERQQLVVAEAKGHPLFLKELCRFVAEHPREDPEHMHMEDALYARVQRLSDKERVMLETIALVGAPVDYSFVHQATGIAADALECALSVLHSGRFIRTGGRGTTSLEPYHDRIRSAVLSHLKGDERILCHANIARALEAREKIDAELLAVHWRGAGDVGKAQGYYVRAAQMARRALAFERAAGLYCHAIALARDRAEPSHLPQEQSKLQVLWVELGESYAHAGLGVKAAEAFQQAARQLGPEDPNTLQQRAAEQLLRSGHIDAGIAVMRPMLERQSLVVPENSLVRFVSFWSRRVRIRLRWPGYRYEEKNEKEVSKAELARMDLCWAMAVGFCVVDQFRGMQFHLRHLEMALANGETVRVARGLAMEAMAVGVLGTNRNRAQSLLNRAVGLVRRNRRSELDAWFLFCSCGLASFAGQWREADALCKKAAAAIREGQQGAYWELNTVLMCRRAALYCMGATTELLQEVQTSLDSLMGRGDAYSEFFVRSGLANIAWLVKDDCKGARDNTREAIQNWSQTGFHLQHMLDLYANVNIDLYQGNAHVAYSRFVARWKDLQRSGLLWVNINRIFAYEHRTRSALAVLRNSQTMDRKVLRRVDTGIARLRRDKLPWSVAVTDFLQAQRDQLVHRGNNGELFRTIAQGFDRVDMAVYAAAARACADVVERGAIARETLAAPCLAPVKNPPRFLSVFAPGVLRCTRP